MEGGIRSNSLEFRESKILYFTLSVSLRQSVEAGRWAVSPGGVVAFQNPQDLEVWRGLARRSAHKAAGCLLSMKRLGQDQSSLVWVVWPAGKGVRAVWVIC